MVASDELVAARIEALLSRDAGLRVTVSRPIELARRIDDGDGAIVVLALPCPRLATMLESLSDRPHIQAVIVLSPDPHRALTALARWTGLRAVLRSDATAEELSAAIAAARAGLVTLHSEALRSPPARPFVARDGAPAGLTPREMEILEMMAEGMSNRTIAARLGISRHTVKFHVASILDKLGALSRTEAVTLSLRRGLISL